MGQDGLDMLMLKSVELDIAKSLNIADIVKRCNNNSLRRWEYVKKYIMNIDEHHLSFKLIMTL